MLYKKKLLLRLNQTIKSLERRAKRNQIIMGCTVSSAKDDLNPRPAGYPTQIQPVAIPVQYPMQPFYGAPMQQGYTGYGMTQQQPQFNYEMPVQHQAPKHQSIPRPIAPIDRMDFVMGLELFFPPSLQVPNPNPVALADHKDEADVVGSSVTAFTKNLTGMHKQDVKNATLFSQLAANAKFDRENDVENWYKYYTYVLQNIGFVIQEFSWQRFQSSSKTFKMDRAVLDILKAAMTRSGTVVANAAIDALGKLPGDNYSVTLFDNQSSSTNLGNFQIGVADLQNNDVIMAFGGFRFKAEKHHTRFLWFSYSSASIYLYQSA